MLSSIAQLKEAAEGRPAELAREKSSERKVIGYFCNYVPEEIIHAAGHIPLRLVKGGEREAEAAGGEYLSLNSCSYAKSCVGLRGEARDPLYWEVDYLAEAPACVQMEWALEIWEKYFGVKTLPIGLPHNFHSPNGLDYFVREVKDFVKGVEAIAGREIPPGALEASIQLYNQIRRYLRDFYELLQEEEAPLQWSELFTLVQAGFVLDRERYLEGLKQVREEIGTGKRAPQGQPEEPRLMIIGSILADGDDKVIRIAEELKAQIVMDDFCTGSRWFWDPVEESTLEGLARRYLEKSPCGTFPILQSVGNLRRERLEHLLEAYRIDGVLYYTLRFCDSYAFKAETERRWLEGKGIPVLHLDSDYSSSNHGQIRTRLEACLEMLRTRKGSRI
ncbi:MAG: 2-hydroxyacyl-CoA dehydratase [Candidatus Tectomicrobia bacterium]|uniref:2-hydroxyacyl-CoA dehydratase n=1 Tax=Tectimicrobiota bacterium TaxID=2528274 RepID=A0A932CNS0_UNCTE|nr:2-hydroxyacyl-CoA dehydratase [Candidatus Tectomicrobia bacterium]